MTGNDKGIKVLIIGAAGMIGRKLTARLLADGRIGGESLAGLVLADIVMPEQPGGELAADHAGGADDQDLDAFVLAGHPRICATS